MATEKEKALPLGSKNGHGSQMEIESSRTLGTTWERSFATGTAKTVKDSLRFRVNLAVADVDFLHILWPNQALPSPWPIPRSANWIDRVNESLTER